MPSSEFDPRLGKEFQFDLLVDGELPEGDRRTLLKSLDKAPGQWRDLAIRFLQRQTEQTAAREVVAAASLQAAPESFSFVNHARRFAGWRMAAGLLLVGMLSAAIGLYYGQQLPVNANVAQVDVKLPSGVGDGVKVVQVRVAANEPVPAFIDNKLREGSRRDVVIAPNGNKAVVFAVSTPYIY